MYLIYLKKPSGGVRLLGDKRSRVRISSIPQVGCVIKKKKKTKFYQRYIKKRQTDCDRAAINALLQKLANSNSDQQRAAAGEFLPSVFFPLLRLSSPSPSQKHHHVISGEYLKHVMDKGKAITMEERRRKLCTNNDGEGGGFRRRSLWSEVAFEHPATFDTLTMDPRWKEEIIDDLLYFSKSQDYYKKVGKVWKRGYLLHGPPGTGKLTMVAAMVNLLKYDVYDLELTTIKNNIGLRKLLINTTSKSIIVIEDIDCSLDVTAQRGRDDGG
ncbi:AAA-ATPase 1 [Perilla frutescens var. hirtella]|uniref:AAA-ATPase 1 n=1 Tax=Perilla frutescens var. hirtella TaxID=608512 RepID=A0AAD4JE15_PERFH|nr:AAA-ATPase 1 [Perilla frutescens var. hirtella]